MMRQIEFETPLGLFRVREENNQIIEIALAAAGEKQSCLQETCDVLLQAKKQVLCYLNGQCRDIQFPYTLDLPPFTKQVLESLRQIPYGSFMTYGELAEKNQKPGAARAVGNALHRNPLLLLLPCHRILGAGNALGGFSAGIEIKKKLLDLEGIRYHI